MIWLCRNVAGWEEGRAGMGTLLSVRITLYGVVKHPFHKSGFELVNLCPSLFHKRLRSILLGLMSSVLQIFIYLFVMLKLHSC